MSEVVDELLARFLWHPDEPVAELLARAPLAPPPPPRPVEQASEEFLAFELAGETYAVPVGAVREVMRVPAITEIPHGQANLLGLINLRGEMLPVYDIRPRLKLASASQRPSSRALYGRTTRVVLLRALEGDAGILAERVRGVVRLPMDALEVAPGPAAPADCVAGIGRRGEELYILLDVEQALG